MFDQPVPQTSMNHNEEASWVNKEVTVVFHIWKQY